MQIPINAVTHYKVCAPMHGVPGKASALYQQIVRKEMM